MPDLYDVHPAFDYWRTGRFGPHGFANATWEQKLTADPMLTDLVMTVELVFGSDAVVYVSSKPCTNVSGTTGRTYQWLPYLQQQPTIELVYQLAEGTSSARSFTVKLPAELVDPTVLISKNRMLAGIGEVSLTFDGADYDDRIVVIRGEMDNGVTFGPFKGGLLETTITDPRDAADVTLPPYLVTTQSFSDPADNAIGKRYPVVFPKFEFVPGVFVDKGTPSGDTFLAPTAMVSSGHLTIEKVYVDGEEYGSGSATYPWAELHASDSDGIEYTAIDFGSTGAAFKLSEGVYATVSTPGYTDGTRSESQDTGALEKDPIAQIRRLCRDYTILQRPGINEVMFARARSKLVTLNSRVCVNAGGSANTTTLSYVEGEFLESFPMISMAWESGGYGPIVTDRMRVASEVTYLIAGQAPLISRSTVVRETPKTSLFNEFQIRYDYNAMEDLYQKTAYRNAGNSTICKASQRMVGYRPQGVIDSLVITEESTAEYCIDWLVAHTAVPSFYVEYEATPALFFQLSRGDNVKLSDDEFGWYEVTASVEKLAISPGRCTVGLRVWLIFDSVAGGSTSFSPIYGVDDSGQQGGGNDDQQGGGGGN